MVEMTDYVENYQLLIYGKLPQYLSLIQFYFYTLKFLWQTYILICSV